MKISYSKYALSFPASINSQACDVFREGLLVKLNKDSQFGFSSICPLPKFGDPSVEECIDILNCKKNDYPFIIKRALDNALIDHEFRSQHKPLLSEVELPQCYSLYKKGMSLDSNSQIKFKVGINLDFEADKINKLFNVASDFDSNFDSNLHLNTKIILDFNQKKGMDVFLNKLHSRVIDSILYIEDPAEQTDELKKIIKKYKISLAADFRKDVDFLNISSVLIIKPTREDELSSQQIKRFINNKNCSIVFTSYMDHPIGQLFGLYRAASFYKNNNISQISQAGFSTLLMFPELNLDKRFLFDKNKFCDLSKEFGIGFNGYLNSIDWVDIK